MQSTATLPSKEVARQPMENRANCKSEAKKEEKPEPKNPLQDCARISPDEKLTVGFESSPAVVLTKKAYQKLFGYARATQVEISCLGIVEREGHIFKVIDFYLLKQESSSASTEIDQEAIAELIEQLMGEGKSDSPQDPFREIPSGKEEAVKMKCWAHSHPGDMGVFWSKTDDVTARDLASDWLISIVVNPAGRILCRIDSNIPLPITIDHVPMYCEVGEDKELIEECKAEVKEKIALRSFSYLPTGCQDSDGWFCGDWEDNRPQTDEKELADEECMSGLCAECIEDEIPRCYRGCPVYQHETEPEACRRTQENPSDRCRHADTDACEYCIYNEYT